MNAPSIPNEYVPEQLRLLTHLLVTEHDFDSGGGLGGEYGYGVNIDTEVFMMHPYCWCEKDDCPWCQGCECPEESDEQCSYCAGGGVNAPNFVYKPTSFKVWWYKYLGRGMSYEGEGLPINWLEEALLSVPRRQS